MNAILGFGQLLADDDLSESQRECVEQILLGAQHLLELSDQLLEVSDRRRRQRPDAPVELSGLVAGAVALCGPLAAQHGLALSFTPPPAAECWALGDDRALLQVLLNLLSNAIKYNRPGGSITLALRAAGDVELEVRDTGTGIAPAGQRRAFKPFERLGAGERGIDGTGLGLALSREMVEAMGGSIGVRSTVGAGSTFSVRLRRAPVGRVGRARRQLAAR